MGDDYTIDFCYDVCMLIVIVNNISTYKKRSSKIVRQSLLLTPLLIGLLSGWCDQYSATFSLPSPGFIGRSWVIYVSIVLLFLISNLFFLFFLFIFSTNTLFPPGFLPMEGDYKARDRFILGDRSSFDNRFSSRDCFSSVAASSQVTVFCFGDSFSSGDCQSSWDISNFYHSSFSNYSPSGDSFHSRDTNRKSKPDRKID